MMLPPDAIVEVTGKAQTAGGIIDWHDLVPCCSSLPAALSVSESRLRDATRDYKSHLVDVQVRVAVEAEATAVLIDGKEST